MCLSIRNKFARKKTSKWILTVVELFHIVWNNLFAQKIQREGNRPFELNIVLDFMLRLSPHVKWRQKYKKYLLIMIIFLVEFKIKKWML